MSDWFGSEQEGPREGDIARQRERDQTLLNQYLAQLQPGSAEYTQLLSEGQGWLGRIGEGPDFSGMIRDLGSKLVQQQGARIAEGGAATPLEARTNLAFSGLREKAAFTPEEESIFSALRGLPTEGQQAPTGQIYSDLVARAQNPNQFYQSTLQEKLGLTDEYNKQAFARRGLLRSGLEEEGSTRASNELAINEASQQEAFRQQQLSNFFSYAFNPAEQLRSREIGVEDALLQMQLGRESKLTDILARNTFSRDTDAANLAQRATQHEQEQDAQESAESKAQRQRLTALLVKAASTAAGTVIGGPVGGAIGSQAGDLLTSARTPSTTSQPRQLSSSLSIAPQQQGQLSATELARLLASTGGS